MKAPGCPVRMCEIRPDFFLFENPMTQLVGFWSDFGPKSDQLGHEIFKSKNGMLSIFKMLSPRANSSRMIDELDGDSCIASLLRGRRVSP